MSLTFDELRAENVGRCNDSYSSSGGLDGWTPTDWACAMSGECGEACNDVKKLRRIAERPEMVRGFSDSDQYAARVAKVALELADLVIYADLLAARLGIDLGAAVAEKFNEVSARKGSPRRLVA